MSATLLLKLTLAPLLIGAATLAARRHGPAAAGWWASTPVIAAPVLLIFALEHGSAFGGDSARGATLGLVSLSAFTCVYALLAARGVSWPVCLVGGYGAFGLGTAALSPVQLATPLALVAACAASVLAREPLRRAPTSPPEATRRLPLDVPLRMGAALALVLVLSAVSGTLGAHTSGLLAPFPVIGSVMAVFTHLSAGRAAVAPYAAALLRGMPSFALSLAVVALTVRPLGIAAAFALSALSAITAHAALILMARRQSERGGPPSTRGPARRRGSLSFARRA